MRVIVLLLSISLLFVFTPISEAKQPNPAIDNTVILCSGYFITVTADPNTLPADGESTSSIVATVTTCGGNPVAGHKVRFSISPAGMGSFSGADPDGTVIDTTDCQGKAEATYISGASPGTATITATDISVCPYISATATITLYKMEITADPERIAAGGIPSIAHQSEIIAQITPAQEGITIDFRIKEGTGQGKNGVSATVSPTSATTDSEGKTTPVTLTSSNVIESCTVEALINDCVCAEVKVLFEPGEADWKFEPPYLKTPGSTSDIIFKLEHNHGTPEAPDWKPVNGHKMEFEVSQVKLRKKKIWVTENLDQYAKILSPTEAITNGSGIATAKIEAGKHINLVEMVEVMATDHNVWKTGSGFFNFFFKKSTSAKGPRIEGPRYVCLGEGKEIELELVDIPTTGVVEEKFIWIITKGKDKIKFIENEEEVDRVKGKKVVVRGIGVSDEENDVVVRVIWKITYKKGPPDNGYTKDHELTVVKLGLEAPTQDQEFYMNMAGPTMPTIELRAVETKVSGMEYRFRVGDPATGRILEYEDAPAGYVHPTFGGIDSGWISTRSWTVDFGTDLYGGHVTHVEVSVRKDGVVFAEVISRDFWILGGDLGSILRNGYIDSLTTYDANVRQMAKVIAIQESGGRHFWPGTGVGTAYHRYYPLREAGVGPGYGVMQLTDPSFLNINTIWNWRDNISTAMDYFRDCYNAGVAHLNTHPAEVTDEMRRLEGYNRYNGGPANRYHWWSTGPTAHNGVPEGWTKFGYIPCPGGAGHEDHGATYGYRDYNNDGVADASGNPYNIPSGPTGPNQCVGRAARYADHCLGLE